MDIHKGSGYPCSSCYKSLMSYKMLRQHEAACKLGEETYLCSLQQRVFQSPDPEDSWKGAARGRSALNLDSPSPALIVVRPTWSRNQWGNMWAPVCKTLPERGLTTVGWRAAPRQGTPSPGSRTWTPIWQELMAGRNTGGWTVVEGLTCIYVMFPAILSVQLKVVAYTRDLVTLLLVLYV